MRIAVSACLLGENCKYNGGNNKNESLRAYLKDHEVLPVCPEREGGLPCPRVPCEIFQGRVIDRNGQDQTQAFEKGCAACLEKVRAFGAEKAILQKRSPSCGSTKIYDGTFSGRLIPGSGLFADALKEAGVTVVEADSQTRF